MYLVSQLRERPRGGKPPRAGADNHCFRTHVDRDIIRRATVLKGGDFHPDQVQCLLCCVCRIICVNPCASLPQINKADGGAPYSPFPETLNNRASPAQMRAAADHNFLETGFPYKGSRFFNVISKTEGFANRGKNNGRIL